MSQQDRKLKLVVDNAHKKPTKKGLSHAELMIKLSNSGGSHLDREQVVLQNLKDMGL